MAIRMQQRRGTAAQWTDANPILAAGEIGWESDTNKFKMGDGINHWDDLDYFLNESLLEGSIDDFIPLTQKGAVNGVAELDGAGKVPSSQLPDIDELSQDAVNNALTAGTGITKNYDDNANTITLAVDTSTIATQSYVDTAVGNIDLSSKQDVVANVSSTEIGYLDGVTSAIQTQLDGKAASSHTHALADVTDVTATASELNLLDGVTASTTEINYLDGVTSAIQTQLNAKLESSDLTGYATETYVNNAVSNLVDSAPSTLDTLNELASALGDDPNFATTITNAIAGKANASHTHLLADITDVTASPAELNVLDGITASTAELNTLDGVTASASEINILDGATLSTTELNYVDGVTSGIQGQLDGKAASAHTHILADVTDVTATAAELNVLDGITASTSELNVLDGITASTTELNYLDGVTSGIQNQLDGKAASIHTHSLSDITDVTASASEVNLLDGVTASTTEINYLDGVTSSIQTQLDNKAPLSSPSFTGTVSGITASMVGLGNVDNTSDADKPISTATQTALDGKLSLSGGIMTGALTLSGAPTQANHAATKAYADSIAEGLHIHASCVAATSVNVNISTDLEAGDVVDGVTLAEGDRVLVKSQTNAAQNGIYVVQASGAALRASDFNEPLEVDGGDFVFVTGGSLYDNTGWVQTTTNVVTIGTDPILFTQFSGAGTYISGTGIEITGNEIAVDFADVAAASHTHNLADVTDVTATAAEVNVLDGITASTAELNILDGVTATASELNILDGATLTTEELNYVDGVTSAIQTQLDGKAAASHTHSVSDITDITASAAELNVLDGITASTTELNYVDGVTSAIQTQLDGKAATSHTHSVSDITDITASAAEINVLDGITASTTELNYVDGVTSSIQTQLDGKAASSHTHAQSDITNLTTDLAAKAPLESPTFTGTVSLPSATSIGNVSSTEIGYLDGVTSAIQTQLNAKLEASALTGYATEAYVGTQITNLVDAAPAALDTLNELAAALNDDANFATTITSSLAGKAPLVSPTFSGVTDFEGLVDFSNAVVTGIDALPSQTGNNGKYLTTDGTTASWQTVPAAAPHPFTMIG